MKKNLVLSIVRNLEIEDLAPFLDSLQTSGFEGDIVFFATDISARSREALNARGVQLIPFDEHRVKFPFRKKKINSYRIFFPVMDIFLFLLFRLPEMFGMNRKDARLKFGRKYFQIFAKRHILYMEYLLANKGRYANVMLTDIRDVTIQADPFAFDIGNAVHCFIEDKGYTLATEKFNRIWIRDIAGNKGLQQLGGNPISCAGVTIGSYDAVMGYLDAMVEAMIYNTKHRGVDQGMHNYLLWTGGIPDARTGENHSSAVMTMGLMDEKSIRFNEDGFIINSDGSIVNVLHQFDRLPDIDKRIRERIRRKQLIME